jgi:rare lipoprotein A
MAIAVTVAGCASPNDNPPQGAPNISAPGASIRNVELGLASWYRPHFRGKHTADGKRYDEDALVGAHRTLPFNTMVLVTNIENGRSVELRIADRGPFRAERIIDVSSRAASELDMKREGVVPVQVEVVTVNEIGFVPARTPPQ